jgi:hypothetical protein
VPAPVLEAAKRCGLLPRHSHGLDLSGA